MSEPGPVDAPRRRRRSMATRISLLSLGIAVVTALVAGALAIGLIRNAGADASRSNLAQLADLAQTAANTTRPKQLSRVRAALNGLQVRTGVLARNGELNPLTPPIVRAAVTATDISDVLAQYEVHASRDVDGTAVFVEGRPTVGGGIFVVQRRKDAVAQDEAAIRRLLWALLIASALAAAIGLLVARRMARPLRRTAAAAHSLAAGNRDVTLPAQGPAEVVEVSDAINTLAGALRHSETRQRQFLLSVSHDLRTPLTAISGYAESLADDVVPADQTAYVGGVMLGEAKRLERLVGDLLDLARLDARDFRIDLAPVDLTGVVHSAAQVWSARCSAAGVLFYVEAPDTPIRTITDGARVRQVLDGLFDNALRVTPTGAPIVLATRAEPGQAVLEVRDGGPGLSDADLAVAFDHGVLYERYRGVRQVGTGLGLAIVRGLVARLGGQVEAGHAHEGGARFTVRLPADG
jgi:two-component system, OmpR family, sensor kinase